MRFKSSYRLIGGLVLTLLLAACSKPGSSAFAIGQPVFSFNYESVSEFFIAKKNPGEPAWTARLAQEGWLGPQQVTPRWVIREVSEGRILSDQLVDGSFIRHLLDNLRTLRKTGTTLSGSDASFGLSPEWTRLAWKEGDRRFELLLGAPAPNKGGRYAKIGEERLIVDGAALDMLELITGFHRIRHQRLITWTLDDADRVNLKWFGADGKLTTQWSAERYSGDWARPQGPSSGATPRPFKK
ncbi:hypothetical protein EBZ37_01160, partial [bacterium]|nr:hypothetical protein [bacterium]